MWTLSEIFAKVPRPLRNDAYDKGGILAPFFLPISSPVPLEVLGMRIDVLLDGARKTGEWKSSIITRFEGVCQSSGIDTVWMLAVYRSAKFGKFKNAGPGTIALAQRMLEPLRCTFDAFPQLRGVLEDVAICSDRRRRSIDFSQAVMALAGIGDWAKEPAIIAALADHGLRPGMPLEELFVYDPAVVVPADPERLTVAEEIARFGMMKISDVCVDPDTFGFDADARLVVVLFGLAIAGERSDEALERARQSVLSSARWHLSPAALQQMRIT